MGRPKISIEQKRANQAARQRRYRARERQQLEQLTEAVARLRNERKELRVALRNALETIESYQCPRSPVDHILQASEQLSGAPTPVAPMATVGSSAAAAAAATATETLSSLSVLASTCLPAFEPEPDPVPTFAEPEPSADSYELALLQVGRNAKSAIDALPVHSPLRTTVRGHLCQGLTPLMAAEVLGGTVPLYYRFIKHPSPHTGPMVCSALPPAIPASAASELEACYHLSM